MVILRDLEVNVSKEQIFKKPGVDYAQFPLHILSRAHLVLQLKIK